MPGAAELSVYHEKLPPIVEPEQLRPVAEMLTANPPAWLNKYLHLVLVMLRRDWVWEEDTPLRAQLLEMFAAIGEATDYLLKVLPRGDLLPYFGSEERPIDLSKILALQGALNDLRSRAFAASQSARFVDKDDKAKPGRSRADIRNWHSARTRCAMMIAETWKALNGVYPAQSNRQAAAAAEALWILAIGNSSGTGVTDPLPAWRPHFAKARSAEAESRREEIVDLLTKEIAFHEKQCLESAADGKNRALFRPI